jgi:succinoglycan biosynthesis transport protein ExoP
MGGNSHPRSCRRPFGPIVISPVKRTGYLNLIWASKVVLVLFAVVVGVVVYFVAARESDQYESKALGQIVSNSQAEGEILNDEQLLSLSNLYGELAKTTNVLSLARENPKVKGDGEEFVDSVGVAPEARVGLLGFTATTGDPEVSANFANAYAEAFSAYLNEVNVAQRKESLAPVQARIDEVETELEGMETTDPAYAGLQVELQSLQAQITTESAAPGDTMRVIEVAVPEANPVSPKPTRNAVLAFIGALVLGAAFIYLRDLIFDRYRSGEEAARDLELTQLGEIPSSRDAPTLESFRTLRTAVMLQLEQKRRMAINLPDHSPEEGVALLVTGAEPRSGKSYTAANLARTLAAEDREVTAVDADLRRPTLFQQFGISPTPGLSDILMSAEPLPALRNAVVVEQRADNKGLRVIPAGDHGEAAVESLSSERMARAVAELRQANDVVVFDTPPTLVVVDPIVISRYVDGVVFVIDSRRTKRRDARRAVEALRSTGAPILGFAYNRSKRRPTGYDSYRPRELRREPWQPRKSPA